MEALQPIEGTPPSLWARPSGCSFHPRCSMAAARCATDDPALRDVGATHSACHFAEMLPALNGRPAELLPLEARA